MCVILIYYAVTYKGCRSIVIEPSNTNNRNIYRDIKKWLENTHLCSKFNDSYNEIEFNNGSIICFKSAESRDKLRGDHCNGILCIDEAQFINQEILQIILPYTDAAHAPLLMISTPLFADPDNLFYKFFVNADNENSFSYDWADPKYDTSAYLTPEKMDFYKKNLSEFKYTTEILGQFITEGGYVFKNILPCIKEPSDNTAISAGIDFGTGTGNDWTVITLFNSKHQMVDIQMVNDMQPVNQIEWLANIINSNPSLKTVLAEKNSIGNVYISALKSKLKHKSILKEFNTTNQSKKDIVENLVSAFANNEVTILDNSELIKQLQHYTVQKLSNGNYTYNNDNPTIHDDAVISTCLAYKALNQTSKYIITFK